MASIKAMLERLVKESEEKKRRASSYKRKRSPS